MTGILDPSGPSSTRTLNSAAFTAVILVGYGENLYPLNQGLNVPSKALMPVGNVPVLNHVLDWVLASGLTDILLLVPPSHHSSISNHLTEYSAAATHPRARIKLLKHTEGEKDDEDLSSESASGEASGKRRIGTARLLRRFRNHVKTDFVLLPCDLYPPRNLALSSILDKHLASSTAILTSVLYEPAPAVKESEEALLVGMDKKTKEMYMIRSVEALEEDLDARMSLLRSHPSVTFTTQYLDAHIYVFRRTVLDLISTRRPKDLDSVREQIVPWLCKGAWQQGLRGAWDQSMSRLPPCLADQCLVLDPPRRNIFAKALAYSISAPPGLELPPDSPPGTPPSDELPRRVEKPPSPSSEVFPGSKHSSVLDDGAPSSGSSRWRCQAIIVAPEPSEPIAAKGKDKSRTPATEPDYLIRVNSLAGYWELNRRLVRYLSSLHPSVRPSAGQKLDRTSPTGSALSASAQISPDSVVGQGTQVGERASLKKCIVGRHCHIARGVKLTGCVVWDFVTIGENTRIENAILCSNVRIGDKATIKDCEFGPGFEAMSGAVLKGERLIAGQEA